MAREIANELRSMWKDEIADWIESEFGGKGPEHPTAPENIDMRTGVRAPRTTSGKVED